MATLGNHPDLPPGTVITVEDVSVPYWVARGWEKVDPAVVAGPTTADPHQLAAEAAAEPKPSKSKSKPVPEAPASD